jgi:phosphonate transport system substrate-binding protein
LNSTLRHIIYLLWFMLAAMPTAHAVDDSLTIGIFPRFNFNETTKQYAPLADYLSERLGRKVTLVTSKDFDSFWKDVTQQRYDIVHYNQYHYVSSAKSYEVIGASKELGKSAVAGVIYVRKDSGITDISQLRGRTIVFGGNKDAMLSYIAPRYLLLRAGLKESDFRTEFAVNPPNALLALYYKQADAAGGADISVLLPVVKNAIDTQDLTVLAETEPLLFLPWAVKRSMSAKLRATIQSILVNLENDGEAGKNILKLAQLTGVGKATDKDYDPHRRMVTTVFGQAGIVQ